MYTFFDETRARHSRECLDYIFVFGSNLAGRHGAGAALIAQRVYQARFGIGRGPTGQAYAIPTKDADIQTLPLMHIEREVKVFLEYARYHHVDTFFVTRIGCGLAGYQDTDIAPMFRGAPENCIFDLLWKPFLI